MKKKRLQIMAVVLIVTSFSLLIGLDFMATFAQRTLFYGSTGSEVRTLQSRLNQLGFNPGPVDGIFGGQTLSAVRRFQGDNSLVVDGIVGQATWGAINQSTPESAQTAQGGNGTFTSNDHMILAKMISGEARGEPYIGQVAVGAVILNRVNDERFPNTVYGVCFQPGAFDAIRDGQYYAEPTESAVRAAREALNGWDPTHGALYYWNPVTATSRWIWTRTITLRIGKHVFGV